MFVPIKEEEKSPIIMVASADDKFYTKIDDFTPAVKLSYFYRTLKSVSLQVHAIQL